MRSAQGYQGQFWIHPVLHPRHLWARNLVVVCVMTMPTIGVVMKVDRVLVFIGTAVLYVLFVAVETRAAWARLMNCGIARDLVASGIEPREVLVVYTHVLRLRCSEVCLTFIAAVICAFSTYAYMNMKSRGLPEILLAGFCAWGFAKILPRVITLFATRAAFRRLTWRYAISRYILPPLVPIALLAGPTATAVFLTIVLKRYALSLGWLVILNPIFAVAVTYVIGSSAFFKRLVAYAKWDAITDEDLLNAFESHAARLA